MGIIGCYSMDLYCDHVDCVEGRWSSPNAQITGRNKTAAYKEAQNLGWTINIGVKEVLGSHGVGKALCPKHSGKKT